jgi:hypothetical protein
VEGVFGRRRRKTEQSSGAGETPEVGERRSAAPEPRKDADRHRAAGPWDASEDAPDIPRMDLGSIRVPVRSGTEIRVDVVKNNQIIGVTLVSGKSAVQVQPFAAPKSSGLWEEMREELRTQITSQGGKAEDFEGVFGPELRAVVPVEGRRSEEGRQLGQRVRFIGVDGPRWVLRGVVRGEAAVKPEAMAAVEELFQGVVVYRGDNPVPPRELLTITVPPEVQKSMEAASRARANGAPDTAPPRATITPDDPGTPGSGGPGTPGRPGPGGPGRRG